MKRAAWAFVLLIVFTSFWPHQTQAWGFFGHQLINRMAVFCLPPEMVVFYKYHIRYITENSVNPDRRRYAVKGEAPRHYIDIDIYGDSAVYNMPRYWNQAVEKYTEDTLQKHGIVPWHINAVKYRLADAFKRENAQDILRISADLGHYIADANVPLHTTVNYNGQLSGQYGIHGFWESRLPELFADEYDFFVGRAAYVPNVQLKAWEAVSNAHLALDSVLRFEKELTERMGESRKFSFEERGNVTMKTYSMDFSRAYHEALNGQVERRMRASIKMVADIWYTAWVDGGQPNLKKLLGKISEEEIKEMEEREKEEWKEKNFPAREHEGGMSFLDLKLKKIREQQMLMANSELVSQE